MDFLDALTMWSSVLSHISYPVWRQEKMPKLWVKTVFFMGAYPPWDLLEYGPELRSGVWSGRTKALKENLSRTALCPGSVDCVRWSRKRRRWECRMVPRYRVWPGSRLRPVLVLWIVYVDPGSPGDGSVVWFPGTEYGQGVDCAGLQNTVLTPCTHFKGFLGNSTNLLGMFIVIQEFINPIPLSTNKPSRKWVVLLPNRACAEPLSQYPNLLRDKVVGDKPTNLLITFIAVWHSIIITTTMQFRKHWLGQNRHQNGEINNTLFKSKPDPVANNSWMQIHGIPV